MVYYTPTCRSNPSPDFKGIKTIAGDVKEHFHGSNPSPDFKGIKTVPTMTPRQGTRSNPSPDFKGIKTSRSARTLQ
jgi:hypothetical protein